MKPGLTAAILLLGLVINFVFPVFSQPVAAATVDFETVTVGSHPSITTGDFEFTPVYNRDLIIRDTDTHALQPRWNDTLQITRADRASFDLTAFDYQRQWPSASGTVQIIGYQVNGGVLQDSFNYDGTTDRSTKSLNWTGLTEVEMVLQGTLQLDDFVVNDGGQEPPNTGAVDFEEIASGSYPEIRSLGMLFAPVYYSSVFIRDSATQALQPRWGDTLRISSEDGSGFDLESFDYRKQWRSTSGVVQVTGQQLDGTLLEASFNYDVNTVTTTLTLNWTGLMEVELNLQGTVQLDNFVIQAGTGDTIITEDFEGFTTGRLAPQIDALPSSGFQYQGTPGYYHPDNQRSPKPYDMVLANDPAGGINQVVRFEIRFEDVVFNGGDVNNSGNYERFTVSSELRPAPFSGTAAPDSRSAYHLRTYIPTDYSLASRTDVLFQWHGVPDKDDNGVQIEPWREPPLSFLTDGEDLFIRKVWDTQKLTSADGSSTQAEVLYEQPVSKGVWVDWVINVTWSDWDDNGSSVQEGHIQVYRNGELIVDHHGPNSFNDDFGVYQMFGPYRWSWLGSEQTIATRVMYYDDIKVFKGYTICTHNQCTRN